MSRAHGNSSSREELSTPTSSKQSNNKDPVEFTSRTKQDTTVADSTTIAKVTDSMGKAQGNSSSREEFFTRKGLSIIQGIGTVAHDTKEDKTNLQNVTMINVLELDCYKTCLTCRGHVELSTSLLVGTSSQQSCKIMSVLTCVQNTLQRS